MPNSSQPNRPRRAASAVRHFIASAPLTFTWLTALLITTVIQHSVSAPRLRELLLHRSTNLHHLAGDPIHVLLSSLLWIDGYYWWPYAIVFCLLLAPAERWLGPLRWLVIGLTAHTIATYIGEGVLYLRIQDAAASPRLINARDIGIAGVLTYRIRRPWRWLYLGICVALLVAAVAVTPGFTQIGHLSALVVGLACYPVAVRKLRSCGPDRGGQPALGALRGAGPPGP
jgi:hypothetical protein